MSRLLFLETHSDCRGNLTVIEKVLPFQIKRLFYIYGVDNSVRGGHRHNVTEQAAICLCGSCRIHCDNGTIQEEFLLDSPKKCLLIGHDDWHTMYDFTPDAVLLVLASTEYDYQDYIFTPYNHHLE